MVMPQCYQGHSQAQGSEGLGGWGAGGRVLVAVLGAGGTHVRCLAAVT